ncbi:HAMP domain-containing sensor histidine kinase [Humisphaera borealis]|uniref:histidine kinase n=1 Tax=Humisphaera borealis TaxID=2807512 RepID=A0A7M2WX59_9BACT|nr:HAMP domain-containing sensor histidine kinase [Humisphaera borealis]QOV90066.1 HAMP domain-containing histidine kinase [Humisphaera borealis]
MPWDEQSARDGSPDERSRSGGGKAKGRPQTGESSGLSLRLRLMLMLLAVFGVIQVGLSVAHLVYDSRTADALFVTELSRVVDAISGSVQTASAPLTDAALQSVSAERGAAVLGRPCIITLYDQAGTVIATSAHPPIDIRPLGPPQDLLAAGRDLGLESRLTKLPAKVGGVTSRIVVRPLPPIATGPSAGQGRLLVVAAPEALFTDLSDRATMNIVMLTPIGLIASAIAGWFIAGIAVRPLRQLGLIASQMRPDNLTQPIDFHSSASELTSLKQELDQMRKRIESGYKAQERFVANVSHEIKTPIATVLTESQTLARPGATPAEIRQFIDSTQDEMRRLGRLVESFLLLTRVRDGKPVESTRARVPVNDVVLDSIQHCWRYAQEHNVKLDPELFADADRELAVIADPDLLRTMIDNLVRNAIRFSPKEDTVKVLVRLDSTDKVCIGVRDRGPGIPESMKEKIFDRFAQGSGDEKLGRGSGLGLEIAQGIAELHGGHISVSNLERGGCEFCAMLPLATAVSPSAPTCHDEPAPAHS